MPQKPKPFIEKMFLLRNQIKPLLKGRANEYHNSTYFDINDVLDMLNPLLKKHRLLLTQPVRGDRVVTLIRDVDPNEKGEHEFEESYLELPKDINPQKMGGAITYFRRYTLVSLLGLEADDDDGNSASGLPAKKQFQPQARPVQTPKQAQRPQNRPVQQTNAPTANKVVPKTKKGPDFGPNAHIPDDKSVPATGIPNDKKPWLDLWDPKKKQFTHHYLKMADEKFKEGLTKERVLSMYKINKRDRHFLDQLFNK